MLLHKTTLGNIFTNSLVTFQVSIPGFQVFLFNIVSALYIFCLDISDPSRNLFLSSSFLIAMNHVSYRPYLNKTIKQFLVFLHRESLKKINLCWNQNFTWNSSTRKWALICYYKPSFWLVLSIFQNAFFYLLSSLSVISISWYSDHAIYDRRKWSDYFWSQYFENDFQNHFCEIILIWDQS